MRIGVNTRLLLTGKMDGIGWFTTETMKRIVRSHPEHEFYFFFDRQYDPCFVFGENVHPVVLFPPARHPILWYLFFEHSDHSLLCSVYIKSCNAETAFRSVGNKLSEICCRDADSSKMVLIFYHDGSGFASDPPAAKI